MELQFDPSPADFLKQTETKRTVVLVGKNGCGKTSYLRSLREVIGNAASIVATNRFDSLGVGGASERKHFIKRIGDHQQNYQKQIRNENIDTGYLQFNELFANLDDGLRSLVLSESSAILDAEVTLGHVQPKNRLSSPVILVDGEPARFASSGVRLLINLLTNCCLDSASSVLIDEPELGLSPAMQKRLAERLFDPDFFAHIDRFVLSTHSPIFLKRDDIAANCAVTRDGSSVSIRPMGNVAEYCALTSQLLGDSLDSLFLPVAIVICEGPSDKDFIECVLKHHLPDRRITVVGGGGDARILDRLHVLSESIGLNGPYGDRIFAIFDKSGHATAMRVEKGYPTVQTVVLDQDGIEHYYPPEIVGGPVSVAGETVTVNGESIRKMALCKKVCMGMTPGIDLLEEFRDKILTPLAGLPH